MSALVTIGAFDAKTNLSALLDRVEAGEEVVITRHGKPIAKISPIPKSNSLTPQQAAERLLELSTGLKIGNWRQLRDDGRK
jgi:prevent-host-death family protein